MYLLRDFWNDMLDKDPGDIRERNVMASHFAKINATFLMRKPAEVRPTDCSRLVPVLIACRPDAGFHSSAAVNCRADIAAYRDTSTC